MGWQSLIPISINVVGIVVALGIFLYAWRRRMVPGAKYFGLYMLAAMEWSLSVVLWMLMGDAIQIGPLTLDGLWPLVGQVGILVMPVMWLAFALKYTGRDRWFKVYLWGPLVVVLLVLFLLQLATDAGVWVYASHDLSHWGGSLRFLAPMGMAIFGVALEGLYVSVLLLFGGLLLVMDMVQSPRIYRGHYVTLLVGGLAPWVLGVPAILRIGPFFEEWVSLAFAIGGLVGVWGIARYRLFDVMPIALDTVAESLDDGVIVLDIRYRIVHLNPAALRMIGRPADELEGVSVKQALPDWTEVLRCLEQGCHQAEIWLGDEPDRRCYDLRTSLLHGRRGAPAGRLLLLRDITHRKQVEEALRASEERLKLAIEGAGLGLWDIDLATGDAFIDSLGAHYLGFAPGERVSEQEVDERLKQYVHPEDRDRLDLALNQHLAGEVPFWEVELRTPKAKKPGEWAWILLRGQVVARDEQGQPLRMAGITQDITRRKRAEEAMRESEERLKIAMEAADLALWDMNLVTNEIVVAHAKGDQDGWEYESETMTDERWAEWLHPEDLARVLGAMDRHMAGETPVYEVEFRAQMPKYRPDAQHGRDDWVWFLQRGRVVAWDEEGRPLRGTGIQEDISARKQAEEELRQAKEAAEAARSAAEAANQAKSVFLANMSHELRTPLNAILGFSELMGRDPALMPEQRGHLETIGRSGRHLLTLINDILEMSKIEAGRTTLYEHSFDLHHLLADLESMFRMRTTRKGLQLLVERTPDVPRYVRTDEAKLRQVLINLLSNAVKFTDEGGVTLRVKSQSPKPKPQNLGLTPRPDLAGQPPAGGAWVLGFEIEDTGVGIAPDELENLFDPFVQTASGIRSQEGTGLGLPISQQFVRLLGGNLTAQSELGRGSVFRFTIQAGEADASEVLAKAPTRRVVGLEPGQPVYRILIAEDRDTNRELLTKLLQPLGFDVREAVDGQEAVEIWETWSPHLIWMDMRMPVMDGYEATRRIKATTKGQATVVIALTASAFEEDRTAILSEGCDDFVRKPFREAEIFAKLAQHLGVRFVYEEQARPAPAQPVDVEGLLAPEALVALPAAWVSELHQAAAQADADLVLDLVEQVRAQHDALAEALTTLVQNFRFDVILDLTKSSGVSM